VTGVPASDLAQVARGLSEARAPIIVYGGPILANADLAASTLSLALLIGRGGGGKVPALGLARASNGVAAARLAGARGAGEAAGALAAFVMLGDAPADGVDEHLSATEFLVVQTAYPSALSERADVVLPARTWPERHGTFVAGDGTTRQVSPLVSPPADIMDDLELIAALGTRLGAAASFTEEALAAKVEVALALPGTNLDRAAPVCVDYL
jgi:predicted molibdopterin-dependent oxidoreductase YjgC